MPDTQLTGRLCFFSLNSRTEKSLVLQGGAVDFSQETCGARHEGRAGTVVLAGAAAGAGGVAGGGGKVGGLWALEGSWGWMGGGLWLGNLW